MLLFFEIFNISRTFYWVIRRKNKTPYTKTKQNNIFQMSFKQVDKTKEEDTIYLVYWIDSKAQV